MQYDSLLTQALKRNLDSGQYLATTASNETPSGATISRASHEPNHLVQSSITDPPTESSSAAVAENSEEPPHLPPGRSKDLLDGIASDASVKPKPIENAPQSHSSDEWTRPTDQER